jgi:hypothetical protein
MERTRSRELRRFFGKTLWEGNLAEMREDRVPINTLHPLVGTWVQEENSINVTSVVYTIKARAGLFSVSGKDQAGGVAVRISNTTWDGEKLRCVAIYPSTKHRASHEFWLTGKDWAGHKIQYSDEHGNHTVNEIWKRSHSAAKA